MDYVSLINDMLVELIPILVKFVEVGICILIAKVVLPWLREQRVYGLIRKCVQAAEKLAESHQIEKKDKYNFVVKILETRGVEITPVIQVLIESAVEELDIIKNEIFSGLEVQE